MLRAEPPHPCRLPLQDPEECSARRWHRCQPWCRPRRWWEEPGLDSKLGLSQPLDTLWEALGSLFLPLQLHQFKVKELGGSMVFHEACLDLMLWWPRASFSPSSPNCGRQWSPKEVSS